MTSYKKAAFLFILLIQTICLSAQSIKINVSGKVTDSHNVPLAGVSVLLLNGIDSTYIAGTASDPEGIFELSGVNPGTHMLSFSMIGYEKTTLPIATGKKENIEAGNIVLKEDAYLLSAVTVTGRQLPFKTEPGKTIVNLSSALLSTDGNILDALKKLPGVIIQHDGTIIMNGKSGVNVLIDDKVTYLSGENLMNYLRSIPAKSIENVELISQQSSKYDAAGNSGIINLQKKRITEQGVNLSASSGFERGVYNRWNGMLSLAIRLNKWNIYADYSDDLGKDFSSVFASRSYLNTASPLLLEMTADRKARYRSQYARAGVDYDLSDRITFGTYLSINKFGRKKNEASISDFYNNGATVSDSTLTSLTSIDYSYTNLTGGTGISYKWPEKGKWDTFFDYQFFDQGDDLMQTSFLQNTIDPLKGDTLAGKTGGDIKIFSGQTNLNYAFNSKAKITAGLKSASVNISTDARYKNRAGNHWNEDTNLSSGFHYRENINAAYVQLNSEWSSRFSSEIGFRLENTNVKSQYAASENDSTLNQRYTHLFPTIMALYHLSGNHSLSITYGRRIVRPNYRDMNPFIEITDQYLHDKGNTELKPELIDNIEFLWLLKKRFSFNLFYSFGNNPIAKSYLAEGDRTVVMPLNLSGNHTVGLKIGLNNLKPVDWWTMHIQSIVGYKHFDWVISGETYKNELVIPMLHTNNQLSLPLGWKAEITGFYSGTQIEGQAKMYPVWSVSVGFRKHLFKNKLGLYIYANDIFDSNQPHIELQNNMIKGWYKERNNNRVAGVTLSYNFHWGKTTKGFQSEKKIEESKRIAL